MRFKQLGNTELELSRVGLGTWAIGGSWQFGWGPQDDNESLAAILVALDNGINWIDTAPVYGCGHSEEIVGRALKKIGQKPIIATKCSLLWNEEREKVGCLDKASIMAECEASLKRLGIEVIDLYQMHWPDPEEQIEEGWEAMATLQKQGKVRYIGASNFNVAQLERVGKVAPVASLQNAYSMIRRGLEKELFGYCKANAIGVLGYSPMSKGLLTGKISAERLGLLPRDDHRLRDPDFQDKRLEINLELVNKLQLVARRHEKTPAQLAIAWVLRREEVTAAIAGARRPSQILETVGAGDWELGASDVLKIEELLAEREASLSG